MTALLEADAAIARPSPATSLAEPLRALTREDHALLFSLLETNASAGDLLQILADNPAPPEETLRRIASPHLLSALRAVAEIARLREQVVLALSRVTAVQTLARLAARDLSNPGVNAETVRKAAAQLLRMTPTRDTTDEPAPSSPSPAPSPPSTPPARADSPAPAPDAAPNSTPARPAQGPASRAAHAPSAQRSSPSPRPASTSPPQPSPAADRPRPPYGSV